MPLERVSIIVCTRNRAEHLQQTLASLATVAVPDPLTVELVVVDNGSLDDTVQIARQQPMPFEARKVVQEPTAGLSYARNRGLNAASGDILLFTDDDVRFPAHWIDGMTRPIRAEGADAVAGGVTLAPHLERDWMAPWHRAYLASSHRVENDPLTDMVGANMAFGRHVLATIPGFDPALGAGRLGACEESLFALKLHQAGFRIAPAFDVVVEHHFDRSRLTREAFLGAARKLGRSQGYIHHHHLPERNDVPEGPLQPYRQLAALWVKLWIKRLLYRPAQGDPPMPCWENYCVRRIAYLQQSLRERANGVGMP
jgi:glycosyltransferase involved in cell wall biosynthesis